ncbi:hypothetical protein AAD001_16665 [Colwelliaceae bacterium 6471]
MSSQLSKSRRNLLLVLGVFIIPVVLAKLALEQHWFKYGVTNQGALSKQELTLTDIGLSNTKFNEQWLMLYRVPSMCDQLCNDTLLAVNNTYTLLGKELPRVTPVALFEQQLSQQEQSNFRHHKWLNMPLPEQATSLMSQSQLVIVDPLGNIVMTYNAPNNQQGLATFSKAILADMKKLLKYSRIG